VEGQSETEPSWIKHVSWRHVSPAVYISALLCIRTYQHSSN
jgi:hypothetical protein